jgi:hypothetical protein
MGANKYSSLEELEDQEAQETVAKPIVPVVEKDPSVVTETKPEEVKVEKVKTKKVRTKKVKPDNTETPKPE